MATRTTPTSSKSTRSSNLLPWLGIALIVIVLDQLTKTLIVQYFQYGDSRTVTSFFNLVRHHNSGAAFSFLANASGWQRWFFVGLGFGLTVSNVSMLAAIESEPRDHAVAQGITTVGLKYNKPVIFGLVTTNTLEQAWDRAGGKHGNKGIEAAVAAIQMLGF